MTILVGIFLGQVGPKYPFCRPFWEGALVWVWALVGALVWEQVWERALVESILQVWWMVQVYIYKGYVVLEAMLFLWANFLVVLGVFLLLFLSTRLE